MRKQQYRVLLFVVLVLSIFVSQSAFADEALPAGKNSFLLELDGIASFYNIRMATVLPGESLTIDVSNNEKEVEAFVSTEAGALEQVSETEWEWTAPDRPGLYPITLERPDTREFVSVNVFVLHPYTKLSKKGFLNGYRIGRYPNNGVYEMPRGFIEVTAGNQNVRVSPHFQLKQFLCKQYAAFPKFVLLSEKLLMKLEMILEKLNEIEYRGETLEVMSGYRTPAYNRSLGNVRYSRHMWGDASDILVKRDLNHDGKLDFKDSLIVRDIVESLEADFPDAFSAGGIGVYKRTGFHGPFVHVDARGFRARWVNAPKRRSHRRSRRTASR